MSFLIQKIQMLGFFMIFLEILFFFEDANIELKNNELIIEKNGLIMKKKNIL